MTFLILTTVIVIVITALIKKAFLSLRGRFYQPKRSLREFSDLPPELVARITDFLPVEDQASLALTCKGLYSQLRSSTRYPSLHVARPSLNDFPLLQTHVEKELVVQFMKRVENSRWKFCLECWKLHSRTSSTTDRCCRCRVLHGDTCMLGAGAVNICPCLTITFPDFLRLTEAASQVQDDWGQHGPTFDGVFAREWVNAKDFLVHRCSIRDHPNTSVDADVEVRFGMDWHGYLTVQTLYSVKNLRRVHEIENLSSWLASHVCHHSQPVEFMRALGNELGLELTGPQRRFGKGQDYSHAEFLESKLMGQVSVVRVTRSLSEYSSNKEWMLNRRERDCSRRQKLL